jgi:ABC-type transport system substrate-binding protein
MKLVIGLLIGASMAALVACGGTETITVVETVVVKGDTVEVIKEVKGDTVEVIKEVKGDTVTVVATATSVPAAQPDAVEELITAPDTSTPAGTAVIAVNSSDMGAQNGLNSAQSQDGLKNVGIAETLFRRAADDSTLNWLANDFTIASDLSGATVKIQQGIPFQVVDGYDAGDLTAHDVAFSMNNANSATNPESIHGQAGDFAGLWGEWTAIDDETVEFKFTNYDSTWKDDYVNQSGQALSILSKKAFDEKGEDWVRDNVVATGPFQIEEWLRDESYTVVNREGTHWNSDLEPKTDRIQMVQVTEATTRSSLLRTGQVDIAHLEPKDAAKYDLTQFTQTSSGSAVQLGIFFAGNLWEDTYGGGDLEGQNLPPKATFVHDLAWIGKPGTSHGEGDLDQAKTVRNALAIAIDRELVNDTLLSGLGAPVDVTYFNNASPNWDAKYEYGYDPDMAVAMINQLDGDYKSGGAPEDGPLGKNAFEISVYAGPELGGGASITGEIADAVAGFWSDIGLETFSLKFSYTAFRPTVVGRANTHPWITSCDKGRASNPWHFPKGLVQTSLTRGGFSCGFESPVILDLYQKMAQAPDTATATAAANDYLAYVYDQALQPGVVAVPDAYYFNNKKVKSFEMDVAAATNLNSLWNLELK